MRVAVIGAGMAGLACASAMARGGAAVAVFDKGRGPGGRLSTRRTGVGTFDHGAPAVQAEGELARVLAATGALSWPGRGWIGQPGMSALVRPLAEGIDLRSATEITGVLDGATGLRLQTAGGTDPEAFDRVVIAVPAPQVPRLCAGPLAEAARSVGMRPFWTAMLAFSQALPDLPDVLEPAGGAVGLAVRESAKPGRAPGERWVVHASEDWTRAHLELDRAEAAAALLHEFRALAGGAEPFHVEGHRWRFGQVAAALGQPFLRHGAVALCGDWCLGPGAQAAWASGRALAADLLAG